LIKFVIVEGGIKKKKEKVKSIASKNPSQSKKKKDDVMVEVVSILEESESAPGRKIWTEDMDEEKSIRHLHLEDSDFDTDLSSSATISLASSK